MMTRSAYSAVKADALLIIVESRDMGLPEAPWEDLVGAAAPARATILAFSDAPLVPLAETLSARGITVQTLAAGPLMAEEMTSFHGEIVAWTAALRRHFATFPDWWLGRFADMNVGEPLWFELLRLACIDRVLSEGDFGRCVIVGNPDLVLLARSLASSRGLDSSGYPIGKAGHDWGRVLFLALARSLVNLWREFIAWGLARRPPRPAIDGRLPLLIHNNYPDHWLCETQSTVRFLGPLGCPGGPPLPAGTAFLANFSRQNRSTLRRARRMLEYRRTLRQLGNARPLLVTESFGTLAALLACHLGAWAPLTLGRWALRWRAARVGGLFNWRGADAEPLVRKHLFPAPVVDWPRNRYLRHCVQRAVVVTGARALLVPVFELAEGRAVTAGGRRSGALTLGLQHGAHAQPHRWRLSGPLGIMASESGPTAECRPDHIAIEGEIVAEWLAEAGFPANRVATVGAPRLHIQEVEVSTEAARRTVIVLGDLHRPYSLFGWCIEALGGSGYDVILRPHPRTHQAVAKWLASLPAARVAGIKLSEAGLGLIDELASEHPLAVLAGATGATMDAALANWPVGIICSNWVPDGNPMTASPGHGVFVGNEPANVRAWLDRLANDAAFRRAYAQVCYDRARSHFAATGHEAAQRLAAFLAETLDRNNPNEINDGTSGLHYTGTRQREAQRKK